MVITFDWPHIVHARDDATWWLNRPENNKKYKKKVQDLQKEEIKKSVKAETKSEDDDD